MANVIKIKRGTGSNPSSLVQGELAIREDTNELFYGKGSTPVVTKLVGSGTGLVDSFTTTLSGLTPSTATTGAVTLSGTLGVANGGTGTNTSPTAGGIIFGKNSSAYGSTGAGTAGQFLVSNGAGTPVWSSTISEDSGGGVILTGGTRGNFNLGSTGKTVGTPSNGDFWWNSNDNTLRFFPNSTSGGKTLAYTSDIPTVNDATLTIAVSGTGLGLSGSTTFTANDADNTTFTVTSNANSANGANTIVSRDANGSFSANIVTASLSGNATSATNVAGGATDQLVYQSGSGSTSFVPAPTGINQILVTGASNLGTSSWIATTGTGNVVRQTSPSITTSLTTGSSTFSLLDTNATTINFGGAGITIDIGAATGNTNVKNNLTVAGNTTITGDLVVQGNTVTVNTSTLEVEDSLISLAKGNTADSIDIGFYGRYGSTATYAGLFRDAGDSKFRLFTGLTQEPNTVVNLAGTGYTAGVLIANIEGDLSNSTGYTVGNLAGLGTNVATFLGTPSSLNLKNAITDETGNGSLVFATSPTLVTPTLGVATATSINKVTITAPANSATLTIADGKTFTVNNTLTFTGTDTSSVSFGAGGTVTYTSNKLSVFAATTSAELAGIISDKTGTGVLVFGTDPILTRPVFSGATKFQGSTSGNTTLSATAIAGTTSLTLPAETGILLSNVSTIDGGVY